MREAPAAALAPPDHVLPPPAPPPPAAAPWTRSTVAGCGSLAMREMDSFQRSPRFRRSDRPGCTDRARAMPKQHKDWSMGKPRVSARCRQRRIIVKALLVWPACSSTRLSMYRHAQRQLPSDASCDARMLSPMAWSASSWCRISECRPASASDAYWIRSGSPSSVGTPSANPVHLSASPRCWWPSWKERRQLAASSGRRCCRLLT
mmetsp:Transcript_98927/g.304886  ORF Transcript_98927/g.304886 Transcript_98927/m.304886 type:complete len:205 (+) Transcript_98927:1042-1656(+)